MHATSTGKVAARRIVHGTLDQLGLADASGLEAGAQASLSLSRAYRNLFEGRATKAEAQIVLADLAKHSCFYQVLPLGTPMQELMEANGKRAVFGRLFRFLRLSEEEVRALEEAARQEALADAREGEI